MKFKLILFLLIFSSALSYAQTGFKGNIVDGNTGFPLSGVNVVVRDQNQYVRSGQNGEFIINLSGVGEVFLDFFAPGYADVEILTLEVPGQMVDLGTIRMTQDLESDDSDAFYIDESQINDEDGSNQTIGSIGNGSDDIFLNAASFNFSPMRFSIRGYDQQYTSAQINGVSFNDGARGRFNYSMLGGMNQMFRNRDVTRYTEASGYGYGDIAGSTNIISRASGFAKGVSANIGATNRAYVLRAMVSAASGILPSGWAFNGSLIYRWSDEGAWDGTFYNSFGYYLGAEKIFNENHKLSIITFGAPTERGQQGATTQEVYDLAGDIYYNPYWGYQNGKKRNSRVVNGFDPTVIASYEWKIDNKQKLNLGLGAHYNKYSSTALTFYNAPDPRPDYYRYVPSGVYMDDEILAEYKQDSYDKLVDQWHTNSSVSQIDWDRLYQANYKNNALYPDATAKYALEERHSNLFETTFNANYNGQLLEKMRLTGGVDVKYSKAQYYKTMNDLLGANQWIDIDQFSERDFSSTDDIVQNDLNNPNRVIKEGDKFGYNYDLNIIKAMAYAQNDWKWSNIDLYYAVKLTYYSFQREGHMRNGRAEYFRVTSYGKGKNTYFVDPSFKAGFAYKFDGRNRVSVNAIAESRAPLASNSYVSPRIKDTQIPGLTSEKILSYDLTYDFNYRRIKGRVSGFQTFFKDGSEIYGYYDDSYTTFINQVLTGVDKRFMGVEAAATYKINGNFSVTAAATWGDYKYTSNALSFMSSENGKMEQENGNLNYITEKVHTKDRYVNNGPQVAASLALNYFHSKMWFAEIKGSFFDKNYLDFAPSRFTESAIQKYNTAIEQVRNDGSLSSAEKRSLMYGIRDLCTQEKLKNGFLVDVSVGKVLYLNNRRQSLNINLSFNNILNNKKMITGGFQQGRIPTNDGAIDLTSLGKFPNKYYYAQGFNFFLNAGYKF